MPGDQIPPGSVFKGYRSFIVQELVIKTEVIEYLLAQWETPDKDYVAAELPKEIGNSHFGPGLHQYIVHQHHANKVSQDRIHSDLSNKNITISAGQINNILLDTADQLHKEKEDLLLAGLKTGYVQTDDTGARHQGNNGFSTVICNEFFAYFRTTPRKSRISFLETLFQEKSEYVIAPETIDYLSGYKISPSTMELMQGLIGKHFTDSMAWQAFLFQHKFGKATRRLLTESTLFGALIELDKIRPSLILLSDGAGQFKILVHALCWIHTERSIKKLIPLNELDRSEIDHILDNFWDYYKKLKAYKQNPSDEQKQILFDLFDTIFSFHATEIGLASALKTIRNNKSQLLLVLDHPSVPLHNNASENDIRDMVIRRKISGGTRSDRGRDARDTFASLYKTCKKLGISFWDYLNDRIGKKDKIPQLSRLILQKSQALAGP